MADMRELIAKLGRAEEGSRELDAEIALALGCDVSWSAGGFFQDANGGPVIHYHEPHGYAGMKEPCPHYTTSLDAALQLAPERYHVSLARWSDGWYARVSRHSQTPPHHQGSQKSNGALALCIATLKARAAGREDGV